MQFKDGLKDRNGERYMLPKRIRGLCDTLYKEYVYTDKEPLHGMEIKQGEAGQWRPFHDGEECWGGRDTHFFFRLHVKLPPRMAGRQVRFAATPGPNGGWYWGAPQVLAYVNGEIRQGMDSNHREIVLTDHAQTTDEWDILLDAYCDMFRYTDPLQMRMSLLCVDTEAEALYYDLLTPLEVAEELPVDDIRRIDLLDRLNQAVSLLDLRQPSGEMSARSIRACREYVKRELYDALCGDQPTQVTALGSTHIDVAWMWTYAQTRDKTARSFSTALAMMERYPNYRFMSSQPQLYAFLKQDHPEVYEKVRARVLEGRWEAEGGMWVEADTNLPSGESLVRQFLYGCRFFEQEFGKRCRVLWLPDVFGYSAALPQIMKKCGVDYFMTTKISWNEYDKMPYDTFMWQGIDGSRVLSHFIGARKNELPDSEYLTTYNAYLNPSMTMGAWKRYQQKDINRDVLLCYGHGDGGGGPEPAMQERGERMTAGIPGCPQVRFGSVREYFEKLEREVGDKKRLPRWRGELYFEYHRGTYTSMAAIKRLNRKAEYTLLALENAAVLADQLSGAAEYPRQLLADCWRTVLLNQFHDVLPGSSIREVYEEVEQMQRDMLARAQEALADRLRRIGGCMNAPEAGLTLLNPLSFDREDLVCFDAPAGVCSLQDADGRLHPVQRLADGTAIATAFAPAKGAAHAAFSAQPARQERITASREGMENAFFRLKFDEKMHICSLLCKESGREMAVEGQPLNRLIAYEDRPTVDQAWNIQPYYQEHSWPLEDVSEVRVLEEGPVRAVVEVARRFLHSTLRQQITLYADVRRIDVHCFADWQEHDTLVKVDFPTAVNSAFATFDIQFGNLQRTTHENTTWDFAQFEVCGHKWADLSQEDYGLAVLNDCKYGWDVKDGHVRLTLLKSSCYPNPAADKCAHEFTYSIYPHEGGWRQAQVDREAFRLNCPLIAAAAPKNVVQAATAQAFLARVDRPDVVLETVKYAEDGDEIILRLYENMNCGGAFTLELGFEAQKVCRCNMLEREETPLALQGRVLRDEIHPYEILTYKITK